MSRGEEHPKENLSYPTTQMMCAEKEKIDMKKKVMAAVLMMSMVAGSSLTVCAAPETMADGTVFDAEYYAQMYPDVVAALGTSADAMYQHYVTFGRSEGRLAYNGDQPLSVETTQTANQPQIIGIQGVVGATYQLPTWGMCDDRHYPERDKVILGTINTEPVEECYVDDLTRLAPYTTEGYEWRFINIRMTGVAEEGSALDLWWSQYYLSHEVDNSKDWQDAGEEVEYDQKFTVTQDGVDYTECKMAKAWGYQCGEVAAQDGAYFLLPKGFRGKVYYTVRGAKFDGVDSTVPDDSNAITFVF